MRVSRWGGVTVWLAVLVILSCVLMATCRSYGQCPGGVCPSRGWSVAPAPVWLVTGRTHAARLLASDDTWDCAVLEIGTPEGVAPAEMACGDEAMQKPGSRLESCGYGSDGKLAVNSGLFVGYRGSPRARGGPADWMAISGRARGGDSGGPIFDSAGRVVGVLWGTNGSEVIGAQAGRLQLVLNRAVQQLSTDTQVASRPPVPIPRQPATESRLLPICRPRPESRPQVIVQSDPAVSRSLQSIDAKLDLIVTNTAPAARPAEPAQGTKAKAVSPLVAGLVVLGCVILGFAVYFSAQRG